MLKDETQWGQREQKNQFQIKKLLKNVSKIYLANKSLSAIYRLKWAFIRAIKPSGRFKLVQVDENLRWQIGNW